MTLLTRWFASTALILLSSCQSIEVKNREWCLDKGALGAHCAQTLTNKTRDLNFYQWEALRFGQVCTADPEGREGETFSEMKAIIEKACSKCRCCTFNDQKNLEAFFDNFETQGKKK